MQRFLKKLTWLTKQAVCQCFLALHETRTAFFSEEVKLIDSGNQISCNIHPTQFPVLLR